MACSVAKALRTMFYCLVSWWWPAFCLPLYEFTVLLFAWKWSATYCPFKWACVTFCFWLYASLRPPQDEVHPGHGGAHPKGYPGAWARAEKSHHPHLLWHDAVWAQLHSQPYLWHGEIAAHSSVACLALQYNCTNRVSQLYLAELILALACVMCF